MILKDKIIIDTDPGVDDALAIILAITNGLNIWGLTTVFGNSDIDNTTKNACKILSILQEDIPIYRGAAMPLMGNSVVAKSHGDDGFGGYKCDMLYSPQKESALTYMINILEDAKEREVTIIVLGPATNIASLGVFRPDLIKKIKKLIILGGVLGMGNITPFAEFNVINDPLAFKKILGFACEKVVIPIDVCRKVFFTLEDFDQIKGDISGSIKQISAQYISYYQSKNAYGTYPGGVMYDLLATAYQINKALFKENMAYMDVVITEESDQYGRTILIEDTKQYNCALVSDVDVEGVKKLFFGSMNKCI